MVCQYDSFPTLAGEKYEYGGDHQQRTFWKGGRKIFLLPLLVSFVVFAVVCLTWMIARPRKDYTLGEYALLSQRGSNGASATYDKRACTNPANFVMQGVDLVAFFSLHEDDDALKGTPEYASIYEGYRFLFSSAENKALFEASPLAYAPAYGGFCAWGIAKETYWNAFDLGPPSSPEAWMITPNGTLLFFRSETPKSWFAGDVDENMESGDANWSFWFGDKTPGASYSGSPLNTDCFCSEDTC